MEFLIGISNKIIFKMYNVKKIQIIEEDDLVEVRSDSKKLLGAFNKVECDFIVQCPSDEEEYNKLTSDAKVVKIGEEEPEEAVEPEESDAPTTPTEPVEDVPKSDDDPAPEGETVN